MLCDYKAHLTGIGKLDDEPAVDYDGAVTVDVRDLPANIRLQIDDIIRNHVDIRSRMDAVDALLYGNRRASDVDAESGIETEDSDSASTSVTSSEYAAAAAVLPTPSVRRDNMTAVNVDTAVTPSDTTSCSDDLGEFIRLMMVQPPPSTMSSDESDIVVVPPPTDTAVNRSDVSPTTDYSPYNPLPPLVEVPEEDATTSGLALSGKYDVDLADGLPCTVPFPPSSLSVDRFAESKNKKRILRNVVVNSCGSVTPNTTAEHREQNVDENSNCLPLSADGVVVADRSLCAPVPAKRCVKSTMVDSVNRGDDATVVSQTSTTPEDATSTKTSKSTLPVSASTGSNSIPPLTSPCSSSEAETCASSRKKTPTSNIWKRLLKRDVDSGGMTSTTWTLIPHRKSVTLQSNSVAESTATFRRRPKNSLPTVTQSRGDATKTRNIDISLPFDFRDLSDVGQKPMQRTPSNEEQSVDHSELDQDSIRSAGQGSTDEDVSSVSDDGVTAANNVPSTTGISLSLFPRRKSVTLQSDSVAESTATFLRRRKNSSPAVTQSKGAVLTAAKARNLHISLPFDFRVVPTDVNQQQAQSPASDEEQLTDHRELDQCSVHSAGQRSNDVEDASSVSDDGVTAANNVPSTTGMTVFPHRHSTTLQSSSVAESTATFRRRPKNSSPTSTQSKGAAKARNLHISLPFDFRVVPTDVSQKPAQQPPPSDEEVLNAIYHSELDQDSICSAGQSSNDVEDVSSVSDDGVTAANNVPSTTGISLSLVPRRKSVTLQSDSVAESTATLQRRRKNSSPAVTQSKGAVLTAAKARNLHISLPFDFRVVPTDVNQQPLACDEKQLSLVDRSEINQDGVQSAEQVSTDEEDVSSASNDELTPAERSETRAKTTHIYRDEQGRLFNAPVDPHIFKTSPFVCLPGISDEQRNSPKNAQHSTNSAALTPGPSDHSSSTSGKRVTLMNIGATLPRFYKRSQPSNEDQTTSSPRPVDLPTTGSEFECNDDELSEVTRSEYLVTGAVRPSPAADTNKLLRRSMTQQPTPMPPLLAVFDSILTLEDDDRPPETVASGRFDTFRGALKPMRWSEGESNRRFSRDTGTKKLRSLSMGNSRKIPAYVDVRPPPTCLAATTDVPSAAAPVAAPRSVNISTTREKERSGKPQKPLKPRFLSQSVGTNATRASDDISPSQSPTNSASDDTLHGADSGTISATDVMHRPEAEVNGKMTYECRISSGSSNADDVFVADVGNETSCSGDVDATRRRTPDKAVAPFDQQAYEAIQSVVNKTYKTCACGEAICDMETMMMALERLRSSCHVNVSTTVLDANCATDGLSTSVRQLVTDSKNLVAGAMSSSSEARLRSLVETSMHTLAVVFLHCCQLVASSSSSAAVDPLPSAGLVADVTQHVMEATRSLRTTVDAARLVLEARSDAGEIDRCKNALLATASLLAKSLSVLVQKVKTI